MLQLRVRKGCGGVLPFIVHKSVTGARLAVFQQSGQAHYVSSLSIGLLGTRNVRKSKWKVRVKDKKISSSSFRCFASLSRIGYAPRERCTSGPYNNGTSTLYPNRVLEGAICTRSMPSGGISVTKPLVRW